LQWHAYIEVLTTPTVHFGFSGHSLGTVESQKLSSVHELVSHKHVDPVVPVLTVTPSLLVQFTVAGAHVPSPLQISCALHVDPLLQRHSVRFAVPALFVHAVGPLPLPLVSSSQVPSDLQSWPAVHSDPLESMHWQTIVFAVPLALEFGHICTVGQ
jgi:hypothetical protein